MEIVIGALLGAFLSLIATVLFQDLLSDLVVSSLSWIRFRKVVNLAGIWDQKWWLDEMRTPVRNDDNRASLKQFGARIYGSFFFNSREYLFRGRIESGGYLNGEWFDRESGPTYSGAFQLRIAADGKTLNGKWIGFSHNDPKTINSGPWIWTLVRKK